MRRTAIHRRSHALSHPLRFEILAILSKRSASPSELADELGANLPDVSYHVRFLVKLNCAELIKQEKVGNRTKRTYRATTYVSPSERANAALDAIARRLEKAEGSPYAELQAVADILGATGRYVTLAGAA